MAVYVKSYRLILRISKTATWLRQIDLTAGAAPKNRAAGSVLSGVRAFIMLWLGPACSKPGAPKKGAADGGGLDPLSSGGSGAG